MDEVWGQSIIERAIRIADSADQIVGFANGIFEEKYSRNNETIEECRNRLLESVLINREEINIRDGEVATGTNQSYSMDQDQNIIYYEHHINIEKNKKPPKIHLHNIMDRLNYIWSN